MPRTLCRSKSWSSYPASPVLPRLPPLPPHCPVPSFRFPGLFLLMTDCLSPYWFPNTPGKTSLWALAVTFSSGWLIAFCLQFLLTSHLSGQSFWWLCVNLRILPSSCLSFFAFIPSIETVTIKIHSSLSSWCNGHQEEGRVVYLLRSLSQPQYFIYSMQLLNLYWLNVWWLRLA